MAIVNIDNCVPYNGSLNYTVTSTDASDGSVEFVYPMSDKLVANVQVVDSMNGIVATTGMLIDDTVAGKVTVGTRDGVAEVITLTIAGDVATTGTADIVVRGGTEVNVAIADEDTAIEVATKIALGTFTGWTVTSSGAIVTFTADDEEAKTGVNTFDLTTSTGITGVFAITTTGEDAGTYSLVAGQKLKVMVDRDNAQFE